MPGGIKTTNVASRARGCQNRRPQKLNVAGQVNPRLGGVAAMGLAGREDWKSKEQWTSRTLLRGRAKADSRCLYESSDEIPRWCCRFIRGRMSRNVVVWRGGEGVAWTVSIYSSAICGPANLRLDMLPKTPSASAWPHLGVRQASDSMPHPKPESVTGSARECQGLDTGHSWLAFLKCDNLPPHRRTSSASSRLIQTKNIFSFILGRLSALFCQVVASFAIFSISASPAPDRSANISPEAGLPGKQNQP